MTSNIDSQIDQLYQLSLNDFIGARNALAKSAGKNAAQVKALSKPSLPAWAVNQLYWKQRANYETLAKASTELRKIHKAILAGHKGDIREATKAHDEAVEGALKRTLALLRNEGMPVTDATRQAVLTTLRALPADEPPGRLTRALQPGGFEMLTGLSIAPVRQANFAGTAAATRQSPAPPPAKTRSKQDARARQQEKEAAAKAARELRLAENEARRDEFEAARTEREAERAARAVERAREALETAQKELDEAERNAREAEKARDAARRRAESSAAAVARLKER